MPNVQTPNNYIKIIGEVASEFTFTHEFYGEKFYSFFVKCSRLSEASDILPVTISERIMTDDIRTQGAPIAITGQIRSYNSYENNKSHLILSIFAKEVVYCPETEENPNTVVLNGYICRKPIYRTTPFGREISDVLIAANRSYNKSDYIPCIAWGRNAKFTAGLEVGTNIKVTGRMQSRKYQKKISEDEILDKTAYEVSVSRIEILTDANDDEDVQEIE